MLISAIACIIGSLKSKLSAQTVTNLPDTQTRNTPVKLKPSSEIVREPRMISPSSHIAAIVIITIIIFNKQLTDRSCDQNIYTKALMVAIMIETITLYKLMYTSLVIAELTYKWRWRWKRI